MASVNGKDSDPVVPPSSLIRRVSSRSIRNSISEDKENGVDGNSGKSFVNKFKKTPEALKTFHMNDVESELEVPGTPMTPRTSTTPEQNDEGGQNYPQLSEEYLSIFKNMPILYEYILATLQERPEVLESSHAYFPDISIYKRNAVERKKRDLDDDDNNDVDEGSTNDDKDNFIGINSFVLSLDPDEIAARAIWVQEELEKYNESK